MVARTAGIACTSKHLRPFSMVRDLAELADLIQVAFAEDLAATGSHMADDMRQMANMGPLLYLSRFAGTWLQGYAWIEDGRLIGNVTITRQWEDCWGLSNVAVDPAWRGRGIGGTLVDTAIEQIRGRGGQRIILQVRSDNPAASALYGHRGFTTHDRVHEMHLSRLSWPIVLRRINPAIRPPRWSERPLLRQLVRASTPAEARAYQRPAEMSWRPGFGQQLRALLQTLSQAQERFALVAAPDGEPVAQATLTQRLLGSYMDLSLHVAPEHRGDVEQALLEALFARLGTIVRRDIRVTLSASHPEGIEALTRLGFRTQRTLDQMGLAL